MEIAIDFDGTCVTHEFPHIGKDIGAVPVLQELVNNGHQLVLFTMRSNRSDNNDTGDHEIENVQGNFLDDAIRWFDQNNIPLYGIQTNPNQKNWTTSPKAYAKLYIDDAALGCPLVYNPSICSRPFVDWKQVREILIQSNIINHATR